MKNVEAHEYRGPSGPSFTFAYGFLPDDWPPNLSVQPPIASAAREQSWEELAASANYRPRELASLCGVSLRTIERHFSRHFGTTLSAWLRLFRISKAYQRICAGEAISRVAKDLGFKQLSHFSRVFKQIYEVPPSTVKSHASFRLQSISEGQPRLVR